MRPTLSRVVGFAPAALCVALGAVALGCGGGDSGPGFDSSSDAAASNDVGAGTDADVALDASSESANDAAVDASVDASSDVSLDATVPCVTSAECPAPTELCRVALCAASVCTTAPAPDGADVPTSAQLVGDCRRVVCGTGGNVVSVAEPSDVPADDGNSCTDETCSGPNAAHPLRAAGAVCTASADGASVPGHCDGAGSCGADADGACGASDQCPAPTRACEVAVCSGGRCSTTTAPAGTDAPASAQASGDCKKIVCASGGALTAVTDPSDPPPEDGYPCTSETCDGPNPAHPAKSVGSACTISADGGSIVGQCDAYGSCFSPTGTTTCGASSCVSYSIVSYPVPGCCAGGARDKCGADFAQINPVFLGIGVNLPSGCNELNQPGANDSACASFSVTMPVAVTFPGCCRANGTCGVAVDLTSLSGPNMGCMDSASFFDGGTPANCVPVDGGTPEAGAEGGVDAGRLDAGASEGGVEAGSEAGATDGGTDAAAP